MMEDDISAQDAATLFAGPGEVRSLARVLDWSTSPLGPTTGWSPAVRMMVRSMFDSPFPICLWAGPEYALIYNDAYRRILVAKHPAALGQPGSIVWAEIWEELQPQFDSVRRDGAKVYFEDAPFVMARLDGGGTETAWFNYSLSPLRDEDGSTAAVLNITPETSGRVLLQRRFDEEQAALARSEEQLRLQVLAAEADAERVGLALAAGAIIGTWFWDLPSDRFTVDEAFATAFGLDPVLGRDGIPLAQIVATVHPDDQAGLADAINEAIKRGGAYAHQYRVRRHDGRYHWLEANGHVEHGPDGTPLRFPGVLLDVTARRFDAAFGRLSELLRTIATPEEMARVAAATVGETLDLSRVAYGDIDAAGERIFLRPNWLAEGQQSIDGEVEFSAFGSFNDDLRRGEVVIIDDIRTDPRTVAQAANFQPVDIGSLVNLPLMEHGRLKVVFCLNQSRPHAWSTEEVIFARRVMDRTETEIARRRAEINLREMNNSLEQQVEERTQERNKIWQTSQDMLLVCDEAGVWLSVNPAWTKVFGWSADELIGQTSDWFAHPEDHLKNRSELTKLAEGITTLNFENRLRTRKGDYRTLVWSAVPEGSRFYCVARDVTAEREQADALLQAEEALRQSQKMEAVGQLTGGVAHDFNNLLTIIRSSVDFLRRPDLPDARKERYLTAVSDTVDRAAKLTGQLLAFARRQVLKPEVFDVGAKLRGVGDMLDTVTGSRIHVSIEVPDQHCYARADLSQFETALVNMAVNARDAMDGEGRLILRLNGNAPKPTIRAHPASENDFVALSVTDTGTGIAPDQLSRIFEPFFTTKEVGKGTGLGLSQVFGFAKQSGGDIDVHSVLGEGTTFTLYLPQEHAASTDALDAEANGAPATGAGQRVLVVEDNVEVGQFCTQILDDLGYITEWSATAEEALDRLGSDGGGFNVVFSDVVMPGMGGVALAEILQERFPRLPVVLTSGYSHVLAHEDDHGFDLLHKPYSAEQLARILQRVMGKAAAPSLKVAS